MSKNRYTYLTYLGHKDLALVEGQVKPLNALLAVSRPASETRLLHTRDGEVVEGSRHLSGGPAFADQSIHRLERRLLDPGLSTSCAYLGRNVLEEVQRCPAALFVCQSRWAEVAATDGTTSLHAFRFCSHGFLRFSLGGFDFRVQGSSHFRGSSQWTVTT